MGMRIEDDVNNDSFNDCDGDVDEDEANNDSFTVQMSQRSEHECANRRKPSQFAETFS